jgi:transposase-like protein
MYFDGVVFKVRHEGSVRHRAAHVAIGLDADGRKHGPGACPVAATGT